MILKFKLDVDINHITTYILLCHSINTFKIHEYKSTKSYYFFYFSYICKKNSHKFFLKIGYIIITFKI